MTGEFRADPAQAAAGWYPVDGVSQRYWDGYEWTNHLAPLAAGQQLQRGLSENDRLYCLGIHIGGIFFSFFVVLIMWLIKREQNGFIDHHGRQAMNLHISFWIYLIPSILLIFVGIGIFLVPIVVVLFYVFGIIAGVKAYGGEHYRIPLTIPFFR